MSLRAAWSTKQIPGQPVLLRDVVSKIKKTGGAAVMAHQLRALAALPEDWSQFPSTHMVTNNGL